MHKFVVLLLLPITIFAFSIEDETLVGDIETVNYYFAPALKLGKLYDNTIDTYRADSSEVYLVGGELGFVLNHRWVVGAAGYALTNNVGDMGIVADDSKKNRFFYGGLLLKYILSPHSIFHFTVSGLLGVGMFQEEETISYAKSRHGYHEKRAYGIIRDNDYFTVVEPGVDMMLNVHKNVRLGAGLS